ncbi:uncharacterized protein LOC136767442 isoform X2 [Amia ocellicauda]|uniref:uncharacterized protein LOC136767442 isoform X2 n=1 Tax=Amia ocellicauda TaxID=2972642 RepID=UPI003463DBDC
MGKGLRCVQCGTRRESLLFSGPDFQKYADRGAQSAPADEEVIAGAVRAAVEAVVRLVCGVKDARLRDCQARAAERDREAERLRVQLETAERELGDLRQHVVHSLKRGCPFNASGAGAGQGRAFALRPHEQDPGEGPAVGDIKVEAVSASPTPEPTSEESHHLRPDGDAVSDPRLVPCAGHEGGLDTLPTLEQRCEPEETQVKKEPPDEAWVTWEASESNACASEPENKPCGGAVEPVKAGDPQSAPPKHSRNSRWRRASKASLKQDPGIQKESQQSREPGPSGALEQRLRIVRLAAAERQRRYREKLRADPERAHALREKELRRYHERKKLIGELPETTQRQRREAWRAAANRYRQKKKLLPSDASGTLCPGV